MGFTVPSAWSPISTPQPVHVGERIRSGDGASDDYQVRGVLLNDRLTRATAMPCMWSLDDADGIETATSGSPSSGTSIAEDAVIRTSIASTGEIDVEVWCEDARLTGGVYVAVINAAGSVVDSTTLQNTTGSTAEALKDTLTGLSADTAYALRVLATGDGTNPAVVYGVRVEDVAQDASSLG